MKKMLFLSVFLLLFVAACAPVEEDPFAEDQGMPTDDPFLPETTQPELPEIIAVVNGEEVFSAKVLEVQNQMRNQGVEIDVEQALEQLVTEVVLIQEANRRAIEVGTQDVEDAFLAQGMSAEELRAAVSMQGMDYEEFLNSQKDQVKLQRMLEQLATDIVVTEEEARTFFEEQGPLMGLTGSFEESKEAVESLLLNQKSYDKLLDLAQSLVEEGDIVLNI